MTTTEFEGEEISGFISTAAKVIIATNKGRTNASLIKACKKRRISMSTPTYLTALCKLELLHYDEIVDIFTVTRKGRAFLKDYKKLQLKVSR